MVTDKKRMEFSARLNSALDQAGVPPKGKGRQSRVAELFGVSQKGARKWLEGEAIPAMSRVADIASWLGVSTEWLISGRGERRVADASIPYDGNLSASASPDSAYPVDAAVIKEILDLIEHEREQADDEPLSPDLIAEIIADNYADFLLQRRLASKRKHVIAAAFERATRTKELSGSRVQRKREKPRE